MPHRLVLACLLTLLAACARPQAPTLCQYSTLEALSAGVFTGQLTAAQLKAKGDFGLGTFAGLDGEMIVLDGQVLRARPDLTLEVQPDGATIPFANVTFLAAGAGTDVPPAAGLAALAAWLDAQLPTLNAFAVARVEARFASLSVRSVPAFSPPYPTLAQALKSQSVRTLPDVEGTLVAIRCPQAADPLAVPGWHFHFATRDRTLGGHVLEASLQSGTARIVPLRRLEMILPDNPDFDAPRAKAADHAEALAQEGAQAGR